jgi:hypothetical protein
MKSEGVMRVQKQMIAIVSVPWNAFVAGFLYYTMLAAVLLSGASPSLAVVGTAYLAPVVAYAVTILARLPRRFLATPGVAHPVAHHH